MTKAELIEQVREHVKQAYIDGAEAVHNSWIEGTNGREPDFDEAASDYAAFEGDKLTRVIAPAVLDMAAYRAAGTNADMYGDAGTAYRTMLDAIRVMKKDFTA